MSKDYFMPRTDLTKELWLKNFSSKLPTYSPKYNITPDDVADMVNSSAYFSYYLNYRKQYEDYLKKLTQEKNELRDGIPAGAEPSVSPQPPVIDAGPAAVAPGIFSRATAIANRIKKHKAYTEADGNDLGIEGSASTVDIHAMKPELTLRLIEGGKPEVQWKKNGMDAIEIYVDRGSGSFEFLAIDTYPHYTDTFPLPAGVSSAIWKYKAIYRYDDTHAGLWSDVVSITVS